MKRSSLALLGAAMVAALGTLGYQVREIARCRTALAREQIRLERLEQQLAGLKTQRTAAFRQFEITSAALADTSATAAATTTPLDPSRASELNAWLARLKRLKQSFDEHPGQRIPEFQFLTELDWMMVARSARFDSEADRRQAWAEVRDVAFEKFRERLSLALRNYAGATPGIPLSDLAQLLPYFKPPIDATLLQRYELIGAGPGPGKSDNRRIVERQLVDPAYDMRHTVSIREGGWATTARTPSRRKRSKPVGDRLHALHRGRRARLPPPPSAGAPNGRTEQSRR